MRLKLYEGIAYVKIKFNQDIPPKLRHKKPENRMTAVNGQDREVMTAS